MYTGYGYLLDNVFYHKGHKYDVFRFDPVTGEYACVIDDDICNISWFDGHELYDMIMLYELDRDYK